MLSFIAHETFANQLHNVPSILFPSLFAVFFCLPRLGAVFFVSMHVASGLPTTVQRPTSPQQPSPQSQHQTHTQQLNGQHTHAVRNTTAWGAGKGRTGRTWRGPLCPSHPLPPVPARVGGPVREGRPTASPRLVVHATQEARTATQHRKGEARRKAQRECEGQGVAVGLLSVSALCF
jgi:hypothetical protein